MIRVEFEPRKLLKALEDAGLAVESPEFMELERATFEKLQDVNYERKSQPRGGLGTDGIRWHAHSTPWAKKKGHDVVGFWQGHLRALVDSRVVGTSIIHEYVTDYAEFFDALRPIIPEALPDAWVQEMENVGVQWLEDRFQNLFDAA